MSKTDEFCIKNEECCIKIEEFFIKNDGFCISGAKTMAKKCDAWYHNGESCLLKEGGGFVKAGYDPVPVRDFELKMMNFVLRTMGFFAENDRFCINSGGIW